MTCPDCGSHDTRVIRTKPYPDERRVWRRRECVACGTRFSTDERIREGSETPPGGSDGDG